jgi:hypothetical protein
VDFIKIDRSFVVAQHDPKGAQVLTGVYAMQPLFDVLDQAVVLNSAALAAGEPIRYVLNSGLLGSFAFIGGSGSAFAPHTAPATAPTTPALMPER